MKSPLDIINTGVTGLIGLADQFIEDKDLRNKFVVESLRLNNEMNIAIMQTKTTPKADAFVKVVMVLPQIMVALKPLIRPLGGALMTCFGAYAHWKGIPLDAGIHAIFDAALPAWGVSRHSSKMARIKQQDKAAGYSGYDEDS